MLEEEFIYILEKVILERSSFNFQNIFKIYIKNA